MSDFVAVTQSATGLSRRDHRGSCSGDEVLPHVVEFVRRERLGEDVRDLSGGTNEVNVNGRVLDTFPQECNAGGDVLHAFACRIIVC